MEDWTQAGFFHVERVLCVCDMKHIGVFLGCDPGSGGMFQYSLSILKALSDLPKERFSVAAAFFNKSWQPYIEPLGLKKIQLADSGREPLTFGRIWRTACLPIGLWRTCFWRLDRVARKLRAEDCDLWL